MGVLTKRIQLCLISIAIVVQGGYGQQLPTGLTQYQRQYLQYLMNLQSLGFGNGNGVGGSLGSPSYFMLSRASVNTNDPEYISFSRVVTVSPNNVVYPQYGAFVAQSPGIYFFTFTLMGGATTNATTNNRSTSIVSLRVNAASMVSVSLRPMEQATGSALLNVQAGQNVYLFIEQGTIFEPNNGTDTFNSFTGYLTSGIPSATQITNTVASTTPSTLGGRFSPGNVNTNVNTNGFPWQQFPQG